MLTYITRSRFAPLVLLACTLAPGLRAQSYRNPVLAGDYPDPSIIRVGSDYWATATTSQWAPVFPLLHSRDLVNWRITGAALEKPPSWSAGSYWAPEIAEHNGRYFIYYTGRKKDGPLCVAVLTAPKPTGPYTDHGPMICQDAGSIDAVPVTDENGERYLVWKEDGNSRKLPTPLWAQKLSPDGSRLVGERHEILRNEAGWEAHLIEGPFILKRGGWLYLFYSADACCGLKCNYKLGVARAKKLLGPWERNPANPLLAGNEHWKCPGHGSPVSSPDGRTFLLYHAYHPRDFTSVGRQMLLDEVTWASNGWPVINRGMGPSGEAPSPFKTVQQSAEHVFADDFRGPALEPGWQWPWKIEPPAKIDPANGGWLVLTATGDREEVLARGATRGDYVATAVLDTGSLRPGTEAGLSAFGNQENAIGIAATGGKIVFWRRKAGRQESSPGITMPATGRIHFRLTASGGVRFRFSWSTDGKDWKDAGGADDGAYLPPWDLGVRIALTTRGNGGASARFASFRVDAAGRK